MIHVGYCIGSIEDRGGGSPGESGVVLDAGAIGGADEVCGSATVATSLGAS